MAFELLVVGYHYVRDAAPRRGIYNLTPAEFSRQLDLIHQNGFAFVSLGQLHEAIRADAVTALPHKACLITHDDGLRESYEVAFPLMQRKGIPGVFYACSAPAANGIVLDVHKFHHVQSRFTNDDIAAAVPTEWRQQMDGMSDAQVRRQYPWDDPSTARMKYLVNFVLPSTERAAIVGSLFDRCVDSEAAFARDLYMDRAQMADLARHEALGSHATSHVPLASLEDDRLAAEIDGSRRDLTGASGRPVSGIAYPYGGPTAVDERVFAAAGKAGFLSGMTMTRGLNTEADLIQRPLQLKRFDTTELYGGKSEHVFEDYLS